jgi:tRNA-2-methylthio-N6-dimethylallyladenosine synthase
VHFAPFETAPRPGDVVTLRVTGAKPHYLLSDVEPLAVRRTRAADQWQELQGPERRESVSLGMPTLR